jgi:hypothetical protein
MARVVRSDPMPGFRTCARPRVADVEDGALGALEEDCPGYESEPCEVVREEVLYTFRDAGSDGSPGIDHDSVYKSTVRIIPVDFEDAAAWACPFCQHPVASFSLEARPQYRALSEQHPDTLRKRSLKQDRQADTALTLQERQATALEALVSQGQESARIAALEAELAEMRALMAQKSTETDVAPESVPDDGPARPKRERARG